MKQVISLLVGLLVALQLISAVLGQHDATAPSPVAGPDATDPNFYFTGFNPKTLVTKDVSYKDGNLTLKGFLVYSNTTTAKRPGVLIVPDWDGISNYEKWRAYLLATQGYVAFVADMFGADVAQGPSLPTPRRVELTAISKDAPAYRKRLTTGLAQLRAAEATDPTKLAAIGYCFGGSAMLELARSYPNGTDGLLGVAGFHVAPLQTPGTNITAGNPIRVAVHNGFLDSNIKPENIATFQAEFGAANVTWEYNQYGKAQHAFTVPSGPQYNKIADIRSWWSLRGFLLDIFGLKNSTNPYSGTTYDYVGGFAAQQ